jgi:hypothetical protein
VRGGNRLEEKARLQQGQAPLGIRCLFESRLQRCGNLRARSPGIRGRCGGQLQLDHALQAGKDLVELGQDGPDLILFSSDLFGLRGGAFRSRAMRMLGIPAQGLQVQLLVGRSQFPELRHRCWKIPVVKGGLHVGDPVGHLFSLHQVVQFLQVGLRGNLTLREAQLG